MNEQVTANRRRSQLIVTGFIVAVGVVLGLVLYLLGLGWVGVLIAFVLAGLAAGWAVARADRFLLRMVGARPASSEDHPRYHNVVDGLCVARGVPTPALHVIDDPGINAFAVGRDPDHGSLAVTTGLLEALDRIELEGVMADELGRIRTQATAVDQLAAVLLGFPGLFSDLGFRAAARGGLGALGVVPGYLFGLLTPLSARLVRSVVGDQEQFLADMEAVGFTRYPPGLAKALEKMRGGTAVVVTASPATSHMWIEAPLAVDDTPGGSPRSRFGRAYVLHPPIDERIAALNEL